MLGGKIGLPELLILFLVAVVVFKTRLGRYVLGGFLLGAFVGFLLRPSVPVIGQLPFDVVITRGADLRGVDVVVRSTAEQSFNYMLVGAIVGAVVLGIGGGLIAKHGTEEHGTRAKVASASAAPLSTISSAAPDNTLQSSTRTSRFCTKCGERIAADTAFCGACGNKV